jgi:RNA-binding protein YhbY
MNQEKQQQRQGLNIDNEGNIKFEGSITPEILEVIQQQLHQNEFLKNKVLQIEKEKIEREKKLDFVYVIGSAIFLFFIMQITYMTTSLITSHISRIQNNIHQVK